jgi:hypothetical protein
MKFPLLRCLLAAGLVFAFASGCGASSEARSTYCCKSVDTEGYDICTENNNETTAPPCSGKSVSSCSGTDVLGTCSIGNGATIVFYYSTGGKTAPGAKAVCIKSGSWQAG